MNSFTDANITLHTISACETRKQTVKFARSCLKSKPANVAGLVQTEELSESNRKYNRSCGKDWREWAPQTPLEQHTSVYFKYKKITITLQSPSVLKNICCYDVFSHPDFVVNIHYFSAASSPLFSHVITDTFARTLEHIHTQHKPPSRLPNAYNIYLRTENRK